ncbi:hypothetical protein SAMN04488518_106201 [Pseudovibrio ascidiaceicola]|uniref:Uncharacterized protein n=1 Tax=Pseudovibrio ascidiaceicola TaxID=285279 RepID=A0A1I4AGR0_9HYPH|nr:hypothetical protein [Pseudovibrio ascidiaceicola]SFK55598.1 hypothetical protein SAMN04488518_106201 [Pseudovibrio ascidiaceicola]
MFEKSVFINCPFDAEYAPLLEAALFTIVYLDFQPRLATESLEAGENRLDKIIELIQACKYSMHDLSLCRAQEAGEAFRMNMPFELGIDLGIRRSAANRFSQKRFLIFEKNAFDLKPTLSDLGGQDVLHHKGNFEEVIRHTRNFLHIETQVHAPGDAKLISEYSTFQGWMYEKKIYEGHSERNIKELPTTERLNEMLIWNQLGRPPIFEPIVENK